MPDPAIETLTDWNTRLACCCEMPACPVPLTVCRSMDISVASDGAWKPGDETWNRYKKYTETKTVTVAKTVSYPDGSSQTESGSAYNTVGSEWSAFVAGGFVGGDGDPCENVSRTSLLSAICESEASYSFTSTTYDSGTDTIYTDTNITTIRENVSGQPTTEHAKWQDDEDAWLAAHPDGPTRVEAKTTYDEWVIADANYTQWLADRDTWVEEDPENRVPADYPVEPPPEPGDEPENPGDPTEPLEFYPPCTFRDTRTQTFYDINGQIGDPLVDVSYNNLITTYYVGSLPDSTTVENTDLYENPNSYYDIKTALSAKIKSLTDFSANDECATGNECVAVFDIDPDPGKDALSTEIDAGATSVKIQFKVPATWPDQNTGATVPFTGNYFKLTFDVVTEPIGWNDTVNNPDTPLPDPLPEGTTEEDWWADPTHQIPREGRPARSYVEDITREWTGPGTGDQSDPSWNIGEPYVMESPGEPGIRKIVNLRFYCYPDSPYGVKPQASGEATDLEEDIPLQSRFTSDKHSINLPKILI